jgi:hypothetical protein
MITGATQLGDDRLLLTVDHDPRTTATDALSGSIIVFVPSGRMFTKKDDGSTTNVVPTTLTPYQFGQTAQVPAGGTLQMEGPGQSLNGFRVTRAGFIVAGSIAVNAVSANTYDLQIRVNGVSAAVVTLAAGQTSAQTIALAVAVAVGDIITTFMVRTAGAGGSTFNEEHATVEIAV